MVTTLLGKKVSMTQLWDDDGRCLPVTVIRAGPCQVVQVKSKDGKDGYDAVQIGFEELPPRKGGQGDPRVNKPQQGHFKRHGAKAHRTLEEIRLDAGQAAPESGAALKVAEVFQGVEKVDVVGTTKGRGFAGNIKRHGFSRGPKTHGSKNYREPGAVGGCRTPGHVHRGKRMAGHYGAARRTVRNLEVVKIEGEHDLIYVKGAVPGPSGGQVLVRKAVRG